MRRVFVFLAGFVVVLLAGAAVAKIGAMPSADDLKAATALEVPEPDVPKQAPTTHKPEPDKVEAGDDVVSPTDKEPPADHEDEAEEPEKPSEEPPTTVVDDDPPDLLILHPKNGAELESSEVVFEGKTEPGARVSAGDFQADVGSDGGWRLVLFVDRGTTVVTFWAVDKAGNESTASITLYYQPPVDTTVPKEEDRDWEFSANAKFGESVEFPPYDIYFGTGRPGDTISITSEYGSGTGLVGPDGGWDAKVEFPEAPIGAVFVVTVTDSFGRQRQFEFVRLG
jgi:hypothetical protein